MTTLPNAQLVLSFIVSTRNRKALLFETIARLRGCGLSRDSFEIIVCDLESSDGTADALARFCPDVRVMHVPRQLSASAPARALAAARGRYIMFLEDDAYPARGTIARMIEYFRQDGKLGAISFNAVLADHTTQSGEYPDLLLSCGAGFRRQALADICLRSTESEFTAESYDLTMRLLSAGWSVKSASDLRLFHLQTPQEKCSWQTLRREVRNSLTVAMRTLPDESAGVQARDWLRRQWRVAGAEKQRSAFLVGMAQGLARGLNPDRRQIVQPQTVMRFTRVGEIEHALREAVETYMLQRVVFIDYGKNMLSYWRAAQACGIKVVAIADEKLAGGRYRGVPILTDAQALKTGYDVAIVSTSAVADALKRAAAWRRLQTQPVLDPLASTARSLAA